MTEHDDQVALFQWVAMQEGAYPELALMFAVPNGAKLPWRKDSNGRRYSPEAMRLKAEGLRPGVPDVCLPVPVGRYHGLFVELKHGDNRPSPEQIQYLNALSARGYCAVVAWGCEEAIEHILNYLNGRI